MSLWLDQVGRKGGSGAALPPSKPPRVCESVSVAAGRLADAIGLRQRTLLGRRATRRQPWRAGRARDNSGAHHLLGDRAEGEPTPSRHPRRGDDNQVRKLGLADNLQRCVIRETNASPRSHSRLLKLPGQFLKALLGTLDQLPLASPLIEDGDGVGQPRNHGDNVNQEDLRSILLGQVFAYMQTFNRGLAEVDGRDNQSR
jgi:hypothetical protein